MEKKGVFDTKNKYYTSQDIAMEFSIEKCAMIIIKSGKRETMEGRELSNKERIRILGEKENDKYSGIMESDTIIQAKIKEKRE